MKKLFSAIFIIFISMAMCFNTVCVKATESSDIDRSKYEDYSGEIDLITGLPKEVAETEDVSTSDVVTLSRGVTYDGATGMYGYEISGGTFTCSAFDGMITTDAVKIAIESENDTSNIEVYRDGKKYDAIPEVIEDTGSYSVVTWNESSETQLLTFQIVGGVTGSINKYVMPDGFNVSKVYLDGKEIKSNRGMVDMTEEGRYEVDYRCVLSRVTYSLLVEVDHTPPVVSFDGIDAKNRADGPVTVNGLAEGDSIVIVDGKGNNDLKLTLKKQIINPGHYHVIVTDRAGNSIEKEFTINVYFNLKAWVFLLILVLVLLGISTALLVSRKKLRVR